MPYIQWNMRKKDIIAASEESKVTELTVNGVRVVDITLTDALHKTAAVFGLGIRKVNDTKRAAGNGPREVHTGNAEYDAAGKEGELVASIYLMGNPYNAIQGWRIGISDSGDLVIKRKNEPKIIDVKMRTKPYHRCFSLTLWQWRNHCFDYYVSAQYPTEDQESIRIWGFIERRKIDALMIAETKRILGNPLKWTYEGTGGQKRVRMDDAEVRSLIAELRKSPKLDKLKTEAEIAQCGIGDFGYDSGPVIAVLFNELSPIEELKKNLES